MQWGVTPPISLALPQESEKRANDALFTELKAQNTYEHATETQKRENVLKSLQSIADVFIKKVAETEYHDNPAVHKSARGRIFTYGSYRLGVFGPGSDIDTLVVGPKYVTRAHFFELFPGLLNEMTPPGAITDLTAVTDAFVPIIKFEYSGISIDLIFSRIATLTEIPHPSIGWDLLDNNLLRGLDDAELRSLNGTRVTDDILKLVPEPTSFRLALRAIKLWAQKRAIYANIMGFPGGVAWAMLVARVCQLYPKANGAVIVTKFFHIIRRWPWPQPVLLKHVEDGPLQVRVWNPKLYKGDGYHLMPIITPAYPSMCATFNITHSSKSVIQKELDHFSGVVDQIMLGKQPWKTLFVKHSFFTQDYKYYIIVNAASTTKENAKIWGGFVESKIRLLVQSLERHPSIQLARPFNKGYERKHRCLHELDEWNKILDGSLDYVIKDEENADAVKTESAVAARGAETRAVNGTEKAAAPNSSTEIKQEEQAADGAAAPTAEAKDTDVKMEEEGPKVVFTSTHYIGLELREGAKSLDLSYEVNEFKNICFAWEKYEKELQDSCAVGVQHVRNWSLPDDVFEAGEVRPTRPLKRKAPDGTNGVRKRKAPTEVCCDIESS
ncbi:Poly(A) polymerase central domain-domain-containing protein [Coniella lustricola]|uniref:Poly(A) polymerase n=1 Tax=Coniella lustricola TaxID=2025994 RepID=A0A2T2ZWW9_9PEZI|nr:Poly(A) polymerase central domain-domain-containing protein [Coniella lustricola]